MNKIVTNGNLFPKGLVTLKPLNINIFIKTQQLLFISPAKITQSHHIAVDIETKVPSKEQPPLI